MNSLTQVLARVNPASPACAHAALDTLLFESSLDPSAADVAAEDLEAWAGEREGAPAPEPDPFTDLAWLGSEADELAARRPDPLGVCGLCGGAVRELVRSMRFHRHESARAYLDGPDSPVKRRHLIYLQPRQAGGYRSPLAEAVAVEAAYYLHLDTDAGNLAAYHLLRLAEECEEFGSRTAEEYLGDEAAYRAAAVAVVNEAAEPDHDWN